MGIFSHKKEHNLPVETESKSPENPPFSESSENTSNIDDGKKVDCCKNDIAKELGEAKAEDVPLMRDTGHLNESAVKAVESAGILYRTVEIVHQGAIPIDLVVKTITGAVEDFRLLKTELYNFQRQGKITFDDVSERFEEIQSSCNILVLMLQEEYEKCVVIEKLDDIALQVLEFLRLVNEKCKHLQSLRKRTAHTWLASTSVASVTVGGAAAALCVLSGGAALPVLAPVIAFGAGTTAVATASHVAFSPTLGAQIKSMDENIKDLDIMRMKASTVARKVEANKTSLMSGTEHGKKHWWRF